MATRSTLLGRARVNAGDHKQLAAPASGSINIVKTVYGFARFTAPATVAVTAKDAAGLDLPLFFASVSPNNPFSWEGWLILEFGTYLEASCVSGPVDVWCSGTVLPDSLAP